MKIKKRLKKFLMNGISIVFITLIYMSFTAQAGGMNYATSKEVVWPGLYYEGYIQCQPSYNDNGYHAARGYYVYRNGADGDVWTYTSYGKNINDSKIYTASSTYRDIWSLDPTVPKVTFNYNFDYVPHGSNIWPLSLNIE